MSRPSYWESMSLALGRMQRQEASPPSPTLAEFAAAVEAAKRGEHLPESQEAP